MTIQRLPGSAITPGTITVTQLDSATATVIQTGGGPKITNIQVTDAAYTVLDDTAVDTAGGNIRITGTGFVTGCSVIVGSQPASSVAFVSSTEVRVQVGAQSAGTYIVYLVNPDGGVGIRVNGLTYSANPAWQTASALPDQYDGVAISLSLVATEATSYTITSGSLPPGLSLNGNTGVITGTVTGVSVDTLYTFTVRATDAQLQDSPRTFTVNITVSDPYFKLTTLLLSGSAISANTVIRDSSTNNFNLTVYGDARASNFTPYGTGWSTYFSSTSGITVSGLTPIGSGDLTIETFVYMTTLSGEQHMVQQGTSTTNLLLSYDGTAQKLRFLVRNDAGSSNLDINSPSAPVLNQWFHFAGTVQGTTGRMWINGNVVTTGTVSGTRSGSQTFVYMGDNGSGGSRPLTGYLSNTRIVVGTAVYTANFSPTTTNLSSVSGTSLLANQSNRFINLVGNVAATISQGSPRITSFNPFNITNTGVNGSIYLDGTGDYLSTPANTAFAMGTGDFTVEFWFYPVAYSGSQNIISHQYNSGFAIGTQTTGGTLEFYIANSFISTTTRPTLGMWNHVVCQRASGTASIYINGTRTQTGSLTGSTASTTALVVGAAVHNLPNEASNGYLSDIRIVKGSAVYSGVTITPPAAPLSAIANTSLLICQYDQPHNNHTFLDSSSNQFLITRSGNASQGTFSPFSQSGWSNYFNGSSYVTLPNNAAFGFSTGNFTVEMWVNFLSFTVGTFVFDGRVPGGSAASILGNIQANQFTASGGIFTNGIVKTGLVTNRWYHIAVVRNGSTLELFFDGVSAGTDAVYSTGDAGASNPFAFGARSTGLDPSTVYISNARIIKGQCLYTGSFTPSVAPLTATSVGTTGTNVASSITGSVSLLVFQSNRFKDNSPNNFTITIGGSPSVQAFSPFAATAVYSPAIHGGSVYLDGTGDYLSTSNPAFAVGTGAFTIEAWVYPFTVSGKVLGGSLASSVDPAGDRGIGFYLDGARIGRSVTAQFDDISTSILPVAYQWNHIALVRENTSTNGVKFYVNGLLGGQGTSAISVNKQQVVVGRQYPSEDANYLNGYISSVRWTNAAVYTSAFTPPTQPLAVVANTQLLTLQYNQPHNNHTFLDSSSNQFLVTRSGNASQGTFSPFSPVGWSAYFPGSSKLVFGSSSAWTFGTGDWTVEHWMMLPTLPAGTISYIDMRQGGALTNHVVFQTYSTGGAGVYVDSSPTAFVAVQNLFTPGQWGHVAYVRESGVIKIYFNGTLVASVASSVNMPAATPSIGGEYQGTNYLTGYISNLRVSKSARYTANFTPSTNSLSSSGASVLTLNSNRFVDVTGNTTISVNTGSPSVQAFSPFAPTAVYNPVTHGGSGYVDGSGDYFILTNESAYDFGDGNFSIDFWYYPLSAQGYGGIYMRDGQDYPLGIYSGTSITPAWPECSMSVGTTTTWFATGINTSGVQKYAWNHIAFTRVGNTFRAFTNGVLSSVVTASGTMGSGGTPWIGKNGTAAGLSELSMYLSGFRMTKGGIPTLFSTSSTTTGTTIFAVPTQPFTANDSLTGGSLSILANFADAAIIDSTGRNVLETVADAKTSSVVTKFTGGSMYFDGTGDYVKITPNYLTGIGTADFTIEGWWYFLDFTTRTVYFQRFWSFGTGLSNDVTLNIDNSGYPVYRNNDSVLITASAALSLSTWTHVALVRYNGTTRIYINGTDRGNTTTNNDLSSRATNIFYIGSESDGAGGYFYGYVSDFRITRYARYTANFTAPTAPARLK